jgi:hypothetical protein
MKDKTTKDGIRRYTTRLDNSRYCAKHTFSLHASDIGVTISPNRNTSVLRAVEQNVGLTEEHL